MFEKAVRQKVRFAYKGSLSVEDLWDLPLEGLDSIYQKLRAEQKEMETDSLLKTRKSGSALLELKVDIVKHIVSVKLDEQEERKVKRERAEEKKRILEIMARKQDAALESSSLEDLEKRLKELD